MKITRKRFSLYQHVNDRYNHPPSGFGFLTPLGLDCSAKV